MPSAIEPARASAWIAALMVAALLAAAILAAVPSGPGRDALAERSGRLDRVAVIDPGRGAGRTIVFTLDGAPDRYRTAAPVDADELRAVRGAEVKTWVQADALPLPEAAAQRTWGLVVAGRAVQSPEAALELDRQGRRVSQVLASVVLLVAALACGAGLVRVRRARHGGRSRARVQRFPSARQAADPSAAPSSAPQRPQPSASTGIFR